MKDSSGLARLAFPLLDKDQLNLYSFLQTLSFNLVLLKYSIVWLFGQWHSECEFDMSATKEKHFFDLKDAYVADRFR